MSRATVGTLLAALVAIASPIAASERYDPRLRFRTISTARFDIHFHQGEEAAAKRLAGLAEQVAVELEPKLGRPRRRVNVILVDQTDLPNGWATPVPYNLIEIVAAAPRAESILGNTNDWLKLVFTHEYTHVLHLERSRGWLSAIGRPFGRLPLFHPNLTLPPVLIEGLATYSESTSTHEGRVPAGDFRMLMDGAAVTGRFSTLARASNAIQAWPSGLTPYVYGAYFHEYLARTYGEGSLSRLADETARSLPYLGVRAFRTVYGKPLGELWKEFERDAKGRAPSPAAGPVRLTRHGFSVGAPWHAADGRLFYSVATPHGFPSLMELTPAGPREVTTRVLGGRLGGSGDEVVFDQVEYVRSVALQSDLYAVNRVTRRVRRLTRGARASDPDVSPDGRTIVCTVQSPNGRDVVTMPLPTSDAIASPFRLASEVNVDYASPRWSPDGRTIAVERRKLNGISEIVLLDPATGAVRQRLAGTAGSRSAGPAWSPDSRTLFFASDRDGRPFQIYAVDPAGGEPRQLLNAGDSAQAPTISPDGRRMVFVGYTADGFDLYSIALADAAWSQKTPASPEMPASDHPGPLVGAGRSTLASVETSYRPGRTLLPRFWTPIVQFDDSEMSVGAATGGLDALGRHGYFASAAWSSRGRPDWTAAYAYDRWRPTLFAELSDDTDPWRTGTARVRELNGGAILRFRRVRRSQALLGAFHGATEEFVCDTCATPVDARIVRRAVRAGWKLDTTRKYGYSISDEYGFAVSAAGEWTSKAFGSTGNAGSVIVDSRGFMALGRSHAVLAARAAGATAWGTRAVRRAFAAGGSRPQAALFAFGRDAVALIRGFATDDTAGRHAAVMNLDYRVPLEWLERGVGTWPVFLRSLHGALFADGGAAWDSRLTRDRRRASIGAELSADVVVGYSVPLTLAGGVAWRHDPTGRSRGAAVFARIGRAF